jgi:hypothetical protein
LTTNWNFDGRAFGRSAGLAPLRNLVHEEGRVAIRAVPVALVVKNTLATLYGEEVQQGKKAGQLSDPVPYAKNGLYCPDCRAPCAKIRYTVCRVTFSACESCP